MSKYVEILKDRSPEQLLRAMKIQKRVIRTREQERRMLLKKEKAFANKILFRCKTRLI